MKMNEKHEACTQKSAPQLYKIGMFAQMNHITVKALRFYEEQGLLLPAFVDSENGYRYYTMNQMADIHQINALKQAGFTLDEIKLINQGADTAPPSGIKKSRTSQKNRRADIPDCRHRRISVLSGQHTGCACPHQKNPCRHRCHHAEMHRFL